MNTLEKLPNPNQHDSIHPQVAEVMAANGVTLEEYLLFTQGSIVPQDGELPSELQNQSWIRI